MAVGLEPWIYILGGYCALAVFVTIFVAAPILSSFGVGDAKSYKHPSDFRPLLASLFLLYLGDIVVLAIEAQSRGELPDATASISISIFALTSAVQLEKLATLERVELSVSFIYLGSWVLLSTVEFFTIIWLWSRPSSACSPYPQFGIAFTALELLAYIALSFLFYHACCARYKSLTQSDIENGDAASESTEYNGDNDESESDSNGCKADPLGIRMEVRKEVGELGGWWPFIKRFRIFFKFMWPFGHTLLQLRFILTLFFVMAGRFISVYKPLQTALLLDALASGTDPWRPLAIIITIDVADTVSSFVFKLLWIDVSLHRSEKLKVEVQSQIMSLDFSFHSQAQPTDVIKAVDNAGSVDTLLDSLIFQFGMNLVTALVAIVQLFHRYGLYVILICTHTAAYYCILEKRYVTVATAEHDKCNKLRDEQERRRQDSRGREPSTQNGDRNLKRKTGKIEFRDVSFSYPGSERLIIDHLSFAIEASLTVAFVGQSGAGKSTICNLLMRNLVPTAGTILIDDEDITTVKKDSLHEHIAMMPQNPYIFNRTVAYNVKYANLEATEQEMYEACRKAGIHETIMARKDGNVSGGERQRILLSRLFLDKTAKVKLIDEGTSALDADTEAGIRQSIEEGLADETVILVAHADRIFVLGTNGKIMEYGTHDELVAKNGEYTKLWKMHIARRQMKSKQKSRSGCQTCKLRRLSSDETKPECRNCQKKGQPCPGYKIRLQWSTKYERQQQPARSEPTNLGELISAVTLSIVPGGGPYTCAAFCFERLEPGVTLDDYTGGLPYRSIIFAAKYKPADRVSCEVQFETRKVCHENKMLRNLLKRHNVPDHEVHDCLRSEAILPQGQPYECAQPPPLSSVERVEELMRPLWPNDLKAPGSFDVGCVPGAGSVNTAPDGAGRVQTQQTVTTPGCHLSAASDIHPTTMLSSPQISQQYYSLEIAADYSEPRRLAEPPVVPSNFPAPGISTHMSVNNSFWEQQQCSPWTWQLPEMPFWPASDEYYANHGMLEHITMDGWNT
ncbi:hypothetical protein GE09DRAFT_1263105 [Coniochaeta sp. 2T2.1]|nr:hypothetical protein GE09DRAFT_1263105 [Coniochaeta sp. 2T2.1]